METMTALLKISDQLTIQKTGLTPAETMVIVYSIRPDIELDEGEEDFDPGSVVSSLVTSTIGTGSITRKPRAERARLLQAYGRRPAIREYIISMAGGINGQGLPQTFKEIGVELESKADPPLSATFFGELPKETKARLLKKYAPPEPEPREPNALDRKIGARAVEVEVTTDEAPAPAEAATPEETEAPVPPEVVAKRESKRTNPARRKSSED
jgi:hypothetical protein